MTQVADVRLSDVQRLLDARCRDLGKAFALRIVGSQRDNGWVYVFVHPDRPGVHTEDYIEIARWVESQLPTPVGEPEILLVPAPPRD